MTPRAFFSHRFLIITNTSSSVNANSAFSSVGCCGFKGETMHFEYICEAVTQGIMRLNLDHKKPVNFGVLAVMNESQAQARAGIGEGSHNHGVEWAQSAVKMALLKKKSSPPKVY
jgi:6,7-dimethyl-8-ribityllumazine synthase